MGYLAAHEVNGSLPRIFTKLKKAGVVRRLSTRSSFFTLAQRKNGDCIFLDDNRRCIIYERRPTICRAFPLNSARPGYCPSQRKSGECGYR